MRMNAVVRAASAVLVTLALVPIVAGQPKAGPDGSDYVPPEKQREKSQANVSEMLERLLAVMEVADKITSKFDGKPGEGSQRGVVNLFMSRTTYFRRSSVGVDRIAAAIKPPLTTDSIPT